MPTWTFVKKAGAPAGTIRISIGSDMFLIDDGTNSTITTSNSSVAAELSGHIYLQLQGETNVFTPEPVIEQVYLANGVLSKPGPNRTDVALPVDFVGSSAAVYGASNYQQKIIRADGSAGFVTNEINLKAWVVSSPNLGNGVNDDTAVLQAWWDAGAAAHAKLVAPAPSVCYTVTGTVYMHPSGTDTVATVPSVEFRGKGGGGIVQWKGPNGTDAARQAVFHLSGFKISKIVGLEVRLPAGTESYVTTFECDNFCTTLQQNISAATAAGTSVLVGSTQHLRPGQQVGVGATGNLLSGAETLTIASIVDGTHVMFTTAPVGSHSIGDRFESPYTSFDPAIFEHCQSNGPGNGQHGLIAWRVMHTDSTAADMSGITWVSCHSDHGSGPSGATDTTGVIGWQIEGNNTVGLTWINCGGGRNDKGVSTRPTTGCGHTGIFGGGAFTFSGGGFTTSAYCDFEMTTPGQALAVIGGRHENPIGNSCMFLVMAAGQESQSIKVALKGVTIQGYKGDTGNEATGKLFYSTSGSNSLTIEDCVIGGSNTALYGAAMVTFATASPNIFNGTLKMSGNTIWATNPFYTVPNLAGFTGTMGVELAGNVLLNTSNNTTGRGMYVTRPEREHATRGGSSVKYYRESYDHRSVVNSFQPASGTLIGTPVAALANEVYTNVQFRTGPTAATFGTNSDGHWYLAAYDSSGNLITQTPDQGTAAITASAYHSLTWNTPIQRPTDELITVALMVYLGTGGAPVMCSVAIMPSLGTPNSFQTEGKSGTAALTTGVAPGTFGAATGLGTLPYAMLYG